MRIQVTIGKKLGIGIAALVVCQGVFSLTSLRAIAELGNSLEAGVNKTARHLELAGEAQTGFQELRHEAVRQQTTYAIGELERRKDAGRGGSEQLACSGCHVPESAEENIRSLEKAASAVMKRTGELNRLITDEAALKAVSGIDRGVASWIAESRKYLSLAKDNRFDDAHGVLRDSIFPITSEVDQAAKTLIERQRAALAEAESAAHRTIVRNRWIACIVIGMSIVVALAVLVLVWKTTGSLREAAGEMKSGADQVAAAATQVASSSQLLAQGACDQAASLEETSASSEEIGAMARRNRESAQAAASLLGQCLDGFANTNTALGQMVTAITDIRAQSSKTAQIIKVTDEIAFQTNILALNAAVEAARAGDAGLGFGVVADEVRALAQRSAEAARQTAELIQETIAKATEGHARVEQVAKSIREITADAAKIRGLVDEVHTGSQDQSRGIDQISQAMQRMDRLTQQAAASAEENASTSEELNAQSEALRSVVTRLDAMLGVSKVTSHGELHR